MAKLRKFTAYRRLERPYTRKSKYTEKSFIRATPTCKVIRFVMGNKASEYESKIDLLVSNELQIRHNALEASRLAANRYLEKTLGRMGFKLVMRVYPHHYLRENPLASGAGADRMSTGMKCSFGKVIGMAAQLKKGQVIYSCYVPKEHIDAAKVALVKASKKLPCPCKTSTGTNRLYDANVVISMVDKKAERRAAAHAKTVAEGGEAPADGEAPAPAEA